MGGSDPPYLYEAPSRRSVAYPYSHFNPKAVTEASYHSLADASAPRPKSDGPLINFNQHPDSYMIVGGPQPDFKPMSPKTKKVVKWLRWAQLALRVIQEIGALGLLVATICITGTSGAVTYLLRIPQAWDALITLYAIYHLIRPAKARTPASSASYHFFALVMDAGLIPFYIFVAMVSNSNYVEAPSTAGRWTSFFGSGVALSDLLLATFVGAAVMAGMHLVSAGLDLSLVILFRKIAKLPPDMNPLEDNLTSKRSAKHKHKNSEFTLNSNASATGMSEAEKKFAHLSGSTLTVDNQSRASLVNDPLSVDTRHLPFAHSRTGSPTKLAFSPHNPTSARWSKHQYDGQQSLYQEAVTSPQKSRYEVRPDGKLDIKPRTRRGSTPAKQRSSVAYSQVSAGTNRSSMLEPSHDDGFGQIHGHHSPASHAAPTEELVRSQQQESLLQDNWYVADDAASDEDTPTKGRVLGRDISRHDYAALQETHDSFGPTAPPSHRNLDVPRPLGMHPPTPPPPTQDMYPDPSDVDEKTAGVNRTPTAASNVTASSSVYSESAPSLESGKANHPHNATPKGKYYGDLAAATRGVRGAGSPAAAAQLGHYGLPSPQASRSPSPPKHREPRAGRVVSRTGADIADESLYVPDPARGFGMRSRRDVSGKIAEEGRGGQQTVNGTWGGGRIFR